jgi:hypothetical protein
MKNVTKLFGFAALAAAIALVFALALASCGGGAGGGEGPGGSNEVSVSTAAWLKSALANPAQGNTVINITGDIGDLSDVILNKAGAVVTIKGPDIKAVSYSGFAIKYNAVGENPPPLFTVKAGTLRLQNITLTLNTANEKALGKFVLIEGGTVEMGNRVNILNMVNFKGEENIIGVYLQGTGSAFIMTEGAGAIDSWQAGVSFDKDSSNNTVTMNGGTISKSGLYGIAFGSGGSKNTVTMTGGTISGNKHGVWMGASDVFAMSGGSINNNTGLGVEMARSDSTLTISGTAVISDNKDSGVMIANEKLAIGNNKLTMSEGTISGNLNGVKIGTSDGSVKTSNNTVTISGGTMTGNGNNNEVDNKGTGNTVSP